MRHVAYLPADVVKFAGAEDSDLSTRRLVEPRQSAQQCCFAGAVIAENGIEFPTGKFRGDAAQRGETAKLLDQVRDSDNGRGFSQGVKSLSDK